MIQKLKILICSLLLVGPLSALSDEFSNEDLNELRMSVLSEINVRLQIVTYRMRLAEIEGALVNMAALNNENKKRSKGFRLFNRAELRALAAEKNCSELEHFYDELYPSLVEISSQLHYGPIVDQILNVDGENMTIDEIIMEKVWAPLSQLPSDQCENFTVVERILGESARTLRFVRESL